jgi:hypothetical protein
LYLALYITFHDTLQIMKLTKSEILALHPCADGLKFAKSSDFDAVKIWETCEGGDWLIWLLRNTVGIDKPTAVKLAIKCALHVLPIFETKYPTNKRPRLAIEAAAKCLNNLTNENKKTAAAAAAYSAAYSAAAAAAADAAAAAAAAYSAAYSAASAAYSAAYSAAAAAAAYSAADSADSAAAAAEAAAAYSAADSADSAAAAADAAAAAAAADSAAAAAARKAERKWQADKIRELIPCPFQQ